MLKLIKNRFYKYNGYVLYTRDIRTDGKRYKTYIVDTDDGDLFEHTFSTGYDQSDFILINNDTLLEDSQDAIDCLLEHLGTRRD